MSNHIASIVAILGIIAVVSYLPMMVSFTSIKDNVNGHWINAYLKRCDSIVAASDIIAAVLSIVLILTWYASDPALIIYF